MSESAVGVMELNQQTRSRDVITAEMADLEKSKQRISERYSLLEETVDNLPEDERTTLDGIECDFEDMDQEAIEAYPSAVASIILEVKSLTDEETKQIPKKEKELKGEMAPYKKEEAEKVRQELLSRVDYSAVLDYYRNLPIDEAIKHNDSLWNAISSLSGETSFKDSPYETAPHELYDVYSRRIKYLSELTDGFVEKRFLKNEPDEIDIRSSKLGESFEQKRLEIAENLDKVISQLEEYSILAHCYHVDLFFKTIDFSLNQTRRLIDDSRFENLGLNFLEAVERHVDEVAAEHSNYGRLPMNNKDRKQERERIESLGIPKNIEFIGFQPPEGMKLVLSTEEINTIISGLIPPDVLNKTRRVDCKTGLDEESDSDKDARKVRGRNVPIFDESGTLIENDIELYRNFFISKEAIDQDLAVEQLMAVDVLLHEFGHTAQDIMNFDEMQKWEEVINNDPIAITEYVDYSRIKDSENGKTEDFAETFGMFLHHPALLRVISTPRFDFMFNYFDNRLQNRQKPAFVHYLSDIISSKESMWKNNGYSLDDVRGKYLEAIK